MLNTAAAWMAIVVMTWAFAIGIAGGIALLLAEFVIEFYEEHFRK